MLEQFKILPHLCDIIFFINIFSIKIGSIALAITDFKILLKFVFSKLLLSTYPIRFIIESYLLLNFFFINISILELLKLDTSNLTRLRLL